ncbi:MAG: hypothetical protein B7Z37_28890 [Verrucomicrobia bacterium 12-59-8]|nr:MAG: hypothetical protein B7Z37_28890 [Verrucomicrobia bacterium 12-59-8]
MLIGNAFQLAAVREMLQAGKIPALPEGDELVMVESDQDRGEIREGDEVLELPASFISLDPAYEKLRPYQVYDQGATGFAWANGYTSAAMLSLFRDAGGYGYQGNGDWRFADAPKPSTAKPSLTAAIGPPKNRRERRRDQRLAAQLLKTVRKRTGRQKPA